MSTYWTYKCKTCDIEHSDSNNHINEELLDVLKMSDEIYKLKELDINNRIEIGIEFYGQDYVNFLLKHHNHDIVVQSEYGDYYTKDGVYHDRREEKSKI